VGHLRRHFGGRYAVFAGSGLASFVLIKGLLILTGCIFMIPAVNAASVNVLRPFLK
jgi:hypothetical protein